jgi:allantoinase
VIIRSRRVVLPDGIKPAEIESRNGIIVAVRTEEFSTLDVDLDAGDLYILPGLVDTHVHINEPGRTDWEGFETATRSAAAGGVTTLVDMPLNSIPATTEVKSLETKRAAAADRCHVDVGFWGGVVPRNAKHLEPLAQAGVLGFKCFLSPSGVDEFENVTEADLREAMPVLTRLGLPLLVHAELPSRLREPAGDPRRYQTWLDSRPDYAEAAAIDLLIDLAREFGTHVHIVHLAAPIALPAIRRARQAGVRLTVESCPHYLTFAAEDVPDGATAFKCAPPIRHGAERDGLWRGLIDGSIDLIATDHSPAPPVLKHLDDGDFLRAGGGIASLQLGLSAIWTGASARGLTIDRVVEWLSAAPARLAGLDTSKGRIAPGFDADFVVFDPDEDWIVSGAALEHRHKVTPYEGLRLRGRVHTTILRGHVVCQAGVVSADPSGRLLSRVSPVG